MQLPSGRGIIKLEENMRTIISLAFLFLTSCAAAHGTETPHPELTSEPCGSSVMNILKVPKGTIKFSVSRQRPKSSDVYINSNFFDHRGPIGELVVGGKRLSSRTRGGGYFFVKSGFPSVSAYIPPKGAEYSSQTLLVAINDGKINKSLVRRGHAKELTYRSLVGTDKSGALYIIASGRGCLVTISDVISYGSKLGLDEAILPDAGSSVDYKLSDGYQEVDMKAIPGSIKRIMKIEEPKSYIVGQITL
jgi:hypothetical protein